MLNDKFIGCFSIVSAIFIINANFIRHLMLKDRVFISTKELLVVSQLVLLNQTVLKILSQIDPWKNVSRDKSKDLKRIFGTSKEKVKDESS